MKIQVEVRTISANRFKDILSEKFSDGGILVEEKTEVFRGADPTIVAAVVGASGVALGALISGIFQILAALKGRVIKIQYKDQCIEIPLDSTEDELKSAIDACQRINEIEKIIIDR